LAAWDGHSEVLTPGANGEQIRVAIKGVRKLNWNVNKNSHVGNTADIIIVRSSLFRINQSVTHQFALVFGKF